MVVGLYDIDLWHGSKAYPNLELMQIYQHLYDRGDKVLFLKPEEDTGRCNKIFYFNDHTKIPKNLIVTGPKKQIFGYAFYHINEPLKPEISAAAPNFLCYDPWTNKLSNKSHYNKMKSSSYVRLETENFGGYKPEATSIFFADNDLFSVAATKNFLEEHKRKHDFYCIHAPRLKDKETAIEVARYTNLFNCQFVCDFDFETDFFCEYLNDFKFSYRRFENEAINQYTERILKMALWEKNQGKKPWNIELSKDTQLLKYISTWILNAPRDQSFQQYYSSNKSALAEILVAATNIRVLLKVAPSQISKAILY